MDSHFSVAKGHCVIHGGRRRKEEKKEAKTSDLLSKLETALEDKANVVNAPEATQAPTPQQKVEKKQLVQQPIINQRNKLGDYNIYDNNSEAAKAMMVQKLNDQTDIYRIRQMNAGLNVLSTQFGLNEMSQKSEKKYRKRGYSKLAAQTHV